MLTIRIFILLSLTLCSLAASEILSGSTLALGGSFALNLSSGFQLEGLSSSFLNNVSQYCSNPVGCTVTIPSYLGLNNVEDGNSNGLVNGSLFITTDKVAAVNPIAEGLTLLPFRFSASGLLVGPRMMLGDSGVCGGTGGLIPGLGTCSEAINGSGSGVLSVFSSIDQKTSLQMIRVQGVSVTFGSVPQPIDLSQPALVQTPEPASVLLVISALLVMAFVCLRKALSSNQNPPVDGGSV